MQVLRLWHTRAHRALSKIHTTRLAALFAAVGGLLKGQQLWLSGVGRHLPSRVGEKHNIKRIDRLLGNCYLRAAALRRAGTATRGSGPMKSLVRSLAISSRVSLPSRCHSNVQLAAPKRNIA